jgi:phosphatidylserine/phosphatidylglycerophosphate/cardiolipin synthase-like enzyme
MVYTVNIYSLKNIVKFLQYAMCIVMVIIKMKKLLILLGISLILCSCATVPPQLKEATATLAIAFKADVINVCFSPDGKCTAVIVEQIDNAKSEILIQAYSFTSAPIAKALVNARKRGIKVEVILDKSQKKERYTSATFLINAGIPVFIDSMHAIAHNKIMIIDRGIVITGSFNFTKAAEEKNAENILFIKSKELAKIYIENWMKHKEHSEEYKGRL